MAQPLHVTPQRCPKAALRHLKSSQAAPEIAEMARCPRHERRRPADCLPPSSPCKVGCKTMFNQRVRVLTTTANSKVAYNAQQGQQQTLPVPGLEERRAIHAEGLQTKQALGYSIGRLHESKPTMGSVRAHPSEMWSAGIAPLAHANSVTFGQAQGGIPIPI